MPSPDGLFYVGTREKMLPLPAVQTNSPALPGYMAVNESLDGSATIDRFGTKRTWVLSMEMLSADVAADLEAMWTGVYAGPMFLLDPLAENLLEPELASSGSIPFRANPFEADPPGINVEFVPPDPKTFPLERLHRTIMRIENTSDATAYNKSTHWFIMPEGTFSFSLYVKAKGGVCEVAVQEKDYNVMRMLTTKENEWERLHGYENGFHNGYTIQFEVPEGATMEICGLQLERGDQMSQWGPGQGVPRVAMTNLELSSPLFPYTTCTATFREL